MDFERVVQTLHRELGAQAAHLRQGYGGQAGRLFVPGRVEVLGKHTDYAGGRSLTCAAARGFAVVFAPRADALLRIVDAHDGRRVELPLDGRADPVAGQWSNYPATVVRRLARNFGPLTAGADVAFHSTLPRSAGLSTSSALITAVFLVLARVNGFDRQEHYRTAIPDDAHLAGYLGAVENGSAFGMLNGDSGVGTSGGSEDHTAILLSTPGHVTCYGYHPVRVERRIALPPALTFVVAASGIAADKTGAARDKYNRASALVRELVRIAAEPDGTRRNLTHLRASRYGGQAEPDGTLADALDASPDAVERLRHAIARADSPFPADVLERRLDHFLVENRQILPAAIEALASGRLGTFGALVDRSQRAAEDLLGNQVPETITLARLARDLGAHAASSFGAGFGGSVWALVDAAGADEFADRWLAAYAEYHPDAVLHAQAFVTRPGAAASPV